MVGDGGVLSTCAFCLSSLSCIRSLYSSNPLGTPGSRDTAHHIPSSHHTITTPSPQSVPHHPTNQITTTAVLISYVHFLMPSRNFCRFLRPSNSDCCRFAILRVESITHTRRSIQHHITGHRAPSPRSAAITTQHNIHASRITTINPQAFWSGVTSAVARFCRET